MPKRTKPPPKTSLPATIAEAEAIEFARRDIVLVREGKVKLFGIVPGNWFEGDESRRACRLMMHERILSNATNLMDAVAFARAGYGFFEEVLRELILEFQNQNRADAMPVYLKAFAMELTTGVRYSKKSGRNQFEDVARDLIIGAIVGKVSERFNLRPTRNAALGRRPSACSIVARALALEGMAMSESNVRHLWLMRRRVVERRARRSIVTAG
jgi:hypothetical protein